MRLFLQGERYPVCRLCQCRRAAYRTFMKSISFFMAVFFSTENGISFGVNVQTLLFERKIWTLLKFGKCLLCLWYIWRQFRVYIFGDNFVKLIHYYPIKTFDAVFKWCKIPFWMFILSRAWVVDIILWRSSSYNTQFGVH